MSYIILVRTEEKGRFDYVSIDDSSMIIEYDDLKTAIATKYQYEQEIDYDPDTEEIVVLEIKEVKEN